MTADVVAGRAKRSVFPHVKALLDFLEADHPERYVFRGQTRMYGGPLLPSGYRDRFTPFDTVIGASRWAGITRAKSLIGEAWVETARALESAQSEPINDGKRLNDIPESAYQHGIRRYYNTAHSRSMAQVSKFMREGTVPGLTTLLGRDDLAHLLCQQYGLTSQGLDVSTNPYVALFFATRDAPFYQIVGEAHPPGVIYRFPRERATIARDLLLPLERSNSQSTADICAFVEASNDLFVAYDAPERFSPGGEIKQVAHIMSVGKQRSSLDFPLGAYERSRIGSQHAAILWPNYRIVRPLQPRDEQDAAALIADLMKTHDGETFAFNHSCDDATIQLDKFSLWPSIRPHDNYCNHYRGLELIGDVMFQDPYLELMQRFFSTFSPCYIFMWNNSDTAQQPTPIGAVSGVIDLGYLLDPSDAPVMAERLRASGAYIPIPTRRSIRKEELSAFEAAFSSAMESTTR
jgi:hypothetical protein